MPTLEVALPSLHAGQVEVARHPARQRVLTCGRRWGKTRLGTALCVAVAASGGVAWWVGPSYSMATVGWRGLRHLSLQIPGVRVREVDRIIEFPTGGWAQVRSADNPDSLRGEGLDFCVIDECAFVREAAWTEALRPALSDRQGRSLFISTPKGRNWFWRLWQRGQSGDPGWMSWSFPSLSNPFLVPSEIAQARADLPERVFAQEYEAVFLEDGAGVFRRVVEAAISEPLDGPLDGHTYALGVDWGKLNDFTVLSLLDVTTRRQVYQDRFNQIDYAVQTGRLRALYDRFRPAAIIAERNSMGEPLIEQLYRAGLPIQPFLTTNATKAAAIEALALAFERGELAILPDPVLIAELQAYEAERLPSGLMRYGAPSGMHDDTVMALALAWQAATVPPPAAAGIDADIGAVYGSPRRR